jgi:hypothetical protein
MTELDWVNLMDIVGREGTTPGFGERRIAAFAVDDQGHLHVREECDDWYNTELTPGEVARLVDWLRMVQARGIALPVGG